MKTIAFTIIALLVMPRMWAQTPSSTTEFNVAGIKVIYKPTLKNVVSIRMYFRGGVNNYQAGKAGVEDLALYAATNCGTKNRGANAFRDSAERYGVLFDAASTYDYGYIQVNCVSKYFNKGWELFSESILSPAFENSEVELLKNRDILFVKDRMATPENRLRALQMQNVFAATPYAVDPRGTEQTLEDLTAADLKAHYQSILNKNRIFIVVVGNISQQELSNRILSSFKDIPATPYTEPAMQTSIFYVNSLFTKQLGLKTNYVTAVTNAPQYTSADYLPFRVAVSGFAGNLFQALKQQSSLSNNPGAGVSAYRMPFATFSASSPNPEVVMVAMMAVLKDIQTRGYNDEWLQHIKNSYITNNYVDNQSSSAITSSLGLAEVLGNWHNADDLPQMVSAVTVDQVNRAINTYIKGIRWNYLGDVNAIQNIKQTFQQ